MLRIDSALIAVKKTQIREKLHHLFIHFFEDLTHYENAFGKLLKSFVQTGNFN
jgi:hypothetical protein